MGALVVVMPEDGHPGLARVSAPWEPQTPGPGLEVQEKPPAGVAAHRRRKAVTPCALGGGGSTLHLVVLLQQVIRPSVRDCLCMRHAVRGHLGRQQRSWWGVLWR